MLRSLSSGQFTEERIKAPFRLITAVNARWDLFWHSTLKGMLAKMRRLLRCSLIDTLYREYPHHLHTVITLVRRTHTPAAMDSGSSHSQSRPFEKQVARNSPHDGFSSELRPNVTAALTNPSILSYARLSRIVPFFSEGKCAVPAWEYWS
jgi:putative component of membrane protein insertase Oxa1/YidC/SpoIIIJ protein YidD